MQFASRGIRPLPPAGVFDAVIIGIYNVGSLWDQFRNNFRSTVILNIQLAVNGTDGKPVHVIKNLTGSMDPRSTLRAWIESLGNITLSESDAMSLDVAKFLLGRSCQVQIQHDRKPNGEMFYKIKTLLPAKAEVKPATPLLAWDYRVDELSACPEWVAKRHAQSNEYRSKYPNGNGPVEQRLLQGQQQSGYGQQRQPGLGGQPNQPAFPAASQPLAFQRSIGATFNHVPGGLAATAGPGPDDFNF